MYDVTFSDNAVQLNRDIFESDNCFFITSTIVVFMLFSLSLFCILCSSI